MRGVKGLRSDIFARHAVFHPEAKGNRKERSPSFLFLEFCKCIRGTFSLPFVKSTPVASDCSGLTAAIFCGLNERLVWRPLGYSVGKDWIEMRGLAKAARKGRSVGKIGARSRNKSDFANNQLNYGAIVRVCVGTAAQVALRCLACALGAGANTLFN